MDTKNKSSEDNFNATFGNMLLCAVLLHKSIIKWENQEKLAIYFGYYN